MSAPWSWRRCPRRRSLSLLIVLVLAAAGLVGADVASSAPSPLLAKPAVPATGTYLGGFVQTTIDDGNQTGDTTAFEAQLHRPLAVDDLFHAWDAFSLDQTAVNDGQVGRIPMVSWACDEKGVDDVLSGRANATIDAAAAQVRSYGHPIFLRFWWEMNLLSGPRNTLCLQGSGPAGYVAEWRYVHDRFVADGATNAAWMWVVGGSAVGAVGDQFYPGDDEVDWVGIDAYSRNGAAGEKSFATVVGPFYDEWATRKPIVVAETGVEGPPDFQAAWLHDMFTTLPTTFPDIKAVIYQDAMTLKHDYRLTGAAAVAAFSAGADLPWFGVFADRSPPAVRAVPAQTFVPGAQVSMEVTTTGFPVPTFHTASPLPEGLSITDRGDGTAVVHGVPQIAGPLHIVVVATSPAGVASTVLSPTVEGAPAFLGTESFHLSTAAPGSAAVRVVAYPVPTMTVTGLPASFRFVPGVAGNGTVVGAPNPGQGGVFVAQVTARNRYGTVTRPIIVTVDDRPHVVTTDAFAASVGQPFAASVGTDGFPRPTVTVGGDAPSWLRVSVGAYGHATLTGVPDAPGVYALVVHLANGAQQTDYDILVTVHR